MTAYTNRHNAKRDGNEPEIVQYLKGAGVRVERLNKPLDLLCGFRGRIELIEVKMPLGKIEDGQQEFMDDWDDYPITVVRSIEDAQEWVRARR